MSTTKKTLGLVIASYKYGHLAAHAIETAISQTVPFDKIYFVDDGAGDCTHLPLIYGDENIEFTFRDSNYGIVKNFNSILFDIVKTDYVMFLGADNWLASDTCESIKKVIFRSPQSGIYDIVTYDITVTGTLRNEIYRFYPYDMKIARGDYRWKRESRHHGSMAYNVELAKEVGGYAHNNTSIRTDEDLNLWNKMIDSGAKLAYLPDTYLFYRRHKENFNKY